MKNNETAGRGKLKKGRAQPNPAGTKATRKAKDGQMAGNPAKNKRVREVQL